MKMSLLLTYYPKDYDVFKTMPEFKHMYDYEPIYNKDVTDQQTTNTNTNNIIRNSIFILKNYYLNNLFLKKWGMKSSVEDTQLINYYKTHRGFSKLLSENRDFFNKNGSFNYDKAYSKKDYIWFVDTKQEYYNIGTINEKYTLHTDLIPKINNILKAYESLERELGLQEFYDYKKRAAGYEEYASKRHFIKSKRKSKKQIKDEMKIIFMDRKKIYETNLSEGKYITKDLKQKLKLIFSKENYDNRINKGMTPKYMSDLDIPNNISNNTSNDCNIFDNNKDFPLLKDFLCSDNVEDFKEGGEKQFVFGNDRELKGQTKSGGFIIINGKVCNKYFHYPWFSETPVLKDLGWSLDYNRAIPYGISNNKMLFPVRFIIPNDILSRYTSYYTDKKYQKLEYIGNIIFGLNDIRHFRKQKEGCKDKHKTRLFNYLLFKNGNNIQIYNERGNKTEPGNIFESIRVYYFELKFLIEEWGMYAYQYKHLGDTKIPDGYDTYKDRTLFLSRFSPKQLQEKILDNLSWNASNKKLKNILQRIIPVVIKFPLRGGYFRIK